jgi:uncharacterized protein YndB with AHSA1/START domain
MRASWRSGGARGASPPRAWTSTRVSEEPSGSRQPPEGERFYLTGEFREVHPPAGLGYTFVWEEPDPDDVETRVGLSFRNLGRSTEVALTQGPFKTEERRALHRDGWIDAFDKLERVFSTQP